MEILLSKLGRLCAVLTAVFLLASSQIALAQGNSNGHGNGKNKNIGVGNASDGIKASVVTNKRIFYTGDPLLISVRFARGAELVSSGEVDASIVIFSPTSAASEGSSVGDVDDSTEPSAVSSVNALTDAIVVPLSVDSSADTFKLYKLDAVDIGTLPPGTYQLGLILTKPEGNPLIINDWYRGLLGLEDIVGLTITDEEVDFDQDGDGLVDDDTDGDGFSDDSDDDSSDTESNP